MLLTGTPLSPPTGLTATALDDNTVSLIWSPAADVPDETGINYEVQRQTPSGWSNVAIVDPTLDGDAAFDTAVAGATTLNYQVRAVDLIDATLNSAYAAFAPVTTPLTQPDAPDNLSATSTTPGQVDLSWDEASPIVTVYAVTATPAYGGTPVTRLAPAYVSAYNSQRPDPRPALHLLRHRHQRPGRRPRRRVRPVVRPVGLRPARRPGRHGPGHRRRGRPRPPGPGVHPAGRRLIPRHLVDGRLG